MLFPTFSSFFSKSLFLYSPGLFCVFFLPILRSFLETDEGKKPEVVFPPLHPIPLLSYFSFFINTVSSLSASFYSSFFYFNSLLSFFPPDPPLLLYSPLSSLPLFFFSSSSFFFNLLSSTNLSSENHLLVRHWYTGQQ